MAGRQQFNCQVNGRDRPVRVSTLEDAAYNLNVYDERNVNNGNYCIEMFGDVDTHHK